MARTTTATAVESKWSAAGWSLQPSNQRLCTALDQVRGNARDLRLWHELKSLGVADVAAVLFLWGGGGRPDSPPQPDQFVTLGGVDVVFGPAAARAWLAARADVIADAVLRSERIDAAWTAVDEHVRSRDTRNPTTSVPTLGILYRRTTTGIIVGAAIAVGSIELLTSTSSWMLWAASSAAAAVALAAAGRMACARTVGLGGLIGLAGSVILVAAASVQAL